MSVPPFAVHRRYDDLPPRSANFNSERDIPVRSRTFDNPDVRMTTEALSRVGADGCLELSGGAAGARR